MRPPQLPGEQAIALLKQRARKLAGREVKADAREEATRVVHARRGALALGFKVGAVREVRRVTVSTLPEAPSGVVGFFQVRGQPFALADLQALEGHGSPEPAGADALAVLLELEGRPLGVVIDEIIGVRTVYQDEVRDADGDPDGRVFAYATPDFLNVIDIPRLFAHPALKWTGT